MHEGRLFRRRGNGYLIIQVLGERGLAARIRIIEPPTSPRWRLWWMERAKLGTCFEPLQETDAGRPAQKVLKGDRMRRIVRELDLVQELRRGATS